MVMQRGFPLELLDASPEVRLEYFKGYTVAHPHLKDATDKLMRVIREPAGAALIFVCGPTGVGKTTLRLRVEQQLIEQALPELEVNRGRIPVAGMEVVAPDSGNFSAK